MNRRRMPYDNESAADFFSFDPGPQSAAHRMRFAPPAGRDTPGKASEPRDKSVSRRNSKLDDGRNSSRSDGI